MRFSTNDENDNAFKYGVKSALEELNIKCVRADNIISSGQLLEKIKRNIEKSRFIIAKVDSDNLNVYFKLGLAMGLDKDVLLVSEKELVLQLPSDLKNWECLTYSKGNYEELKTNSAIFNYAVKYYDYLAMAITVVDIVNGAAYLFDKMPDTDNQHWKADLELEQFQKC